MLIFMGEKIERRVNSSEFEPTWGEFLTPVAGSRSYTERVGRLLAESSNSLEYSRNCLRVLWSATGLGLCRAVEFAAVLGTAYYFLG